uniref:Beta-defensin n=1 Tax=Moschus moschiferus TaxID=68415 RepID=A0A8C6FPF8_MOSMO
MNLLMLTFMLCGLLTLVTKAGWFVERCWKNDIGYCRKRCLLLERYKLLCMNKQSCCIPLRSYDPYTQWPINPTFFKDLNVDYITRDDFPFSPESGFTDEVTVKATTTQESRVTEISTPTPESTEDTTFSDEPETADLYKCWD